LRESPKKRQGIKNVVKENLSSQIVLQEHHAVLVISDRQQHFCRDRETAIEKRSKEAILQSMCDSGIMKFLYRWGLPWWINTSRGIHVRRSRWGSSAKTRLRRIPQIGVRSREIALKGRMPWDATSDSRILFDDSASRSRRAKSEQFATHFLFHDLETFAIFLFLNESRISRDKI